MNSSYRTPRQKIVKVVSPKGKSVRWVKSVSNQRIEYTKDVSEAGVFVPMNMKFIRMHIGHGYKMQTLNANQFTPATKGIEQILKDANTGVQSDFFEG